ncbi:hypothetical protein [Pseudaminobacter sp. NGMCC 1.201702]|uniref:hypothetical protein n=1 Tax=Pseudaminobacter sp. NGMCC 1.201702 TaxID=3391825 RepID=UPI0039EF3D98
MADERTARPVSGEIMTEAADAALRSRPAADDVLDADYEIVPGMDAGQMADKAPAVDNAVSGMDMLRRAMPAQRIRGARGGPIFWSVGIAFAAAAFWVSGGHALVRQPAFNAGQMAGALTIAGVRSRVENTGSRPVLFVDGEAINGSASDVPFPALEIHVTANDGQTARYNLGTLGHSLVAKGRLAFSSRLEMPKNGVKTVSVTFAE